MPVIGFLNSASPGPFVAFVQAFREGLSEAGFIDGKNVAIEFRWAEGRYERLPELAASLVNRPATLIVATGGTMSARAAKAATTTLPVLFLIGMDPIKAGLVASMNRPGGNVTGVTMQTTAILDKRLQLLRYLVPKAETIALLVNPDTDGVQVEIDDIVRVTTERGLQPVALSIRKRFRVRLPQQFWCSRGESAVLLANRRAQLINLASSHFPFQPRTRGAICRTGGLMSYGPNISAAYRQMGRRPPRPRRLRPANAGRTATKH
jgi:putative ABC transport system substrate-binding protein